MRFSMVCVVETLMMIVWSRLLTVVEPSMTSVGVEIIVVTTVVLLIDVDDETM